MALEKQTYYFLYSVHHLWPFGQSFFQTFFVFWAGFTTGWSFRVFTISVFEQTFGWPCFNFSELTFLRSLWISRIEITVTVKPMYCPTILLNNKYWLSCYLAVNSVAFYNALVKMIMMLITIIKMFLIVIKSLNSDLEY